MRMKKCVCLIGGLLFLLSFSSAQALLQEPVEILIGDGQTVRTQAPKFGPSCPSLVPMACTVICDWGDYMTATVSGTGSSCTAAQNALTSQLHSLAQGSCESITGLPSHCRFQVLVTTACAQVSPGVWQVQGYAKHSCRMSTC